MAQRGKRYNAARPIDVNLNNVRIGGNYAALLRAQGNSNITSAKPNPELEPGHIAPERVAFVEKLKRRMREPDWCAGYGWLMLRENYEIYEREDGLTQDEYYEIAKVAINTGPEQMNRLRTDKVSDVRYYELCKIMASHAVFYNVDYEKLNRGDSNGTYKIANLAVDSLCKLTADFEVQNVVRSIRNKAKSQTPHMSERDAAQLLFYMWLIVHNELLVGVSNKEITEFVDKGLVIPMDADRYIMKFTQNAKNNPCTGLLKSIMLGQGKDVPEFCKKAQSRVLDVYDDVFRREKARGK